MYTFTQPTDEWQSTVQHNPAPHSTHAEMIRDFNPSGFLIKVTLHASGASISAVAATTERVFAVVHIYPWALCLLL